MSNSTGKRALVLGLVASLLIIFWAPAAHAGPDVRGGVCRGERVVRCIEVHYDPTDGGRFRAHALIFDNGGDAVDYNVDVTGINGFVDTPGGAHDVIDRAEGPLLPCIYGGTVTVAFAAGYQWRQVPGGELIDGVLPTTARVC